MIDLIPDSPLADRLNHAIATFGNAQEQLHHLRMLDLARIVRDALPAAEAVVVDEPTSTSIPRACGCTECRCTGRR